MKKKISRRNFLRTAPLAAAAGVAGVDSLAALAQADGMVTAPQPYKAWTSDDLDKAVKALNAQPGDNTLYPANGTLGIVMTAERAKSAAEFEWHEGHDHLVQILDGTTLYEVGGTPKEPRQTGPGEGRAAGATGSRSIIMEKGDMLLIPRGTLHKRSTEDSVTFLLISTPAPAKA